MNKLSSYIVSLLLVSFVSCSDDSSTNPPSNVDSFVFPLAIGNEWVYEFYWLDENYNEMGEQQDIEKSKINGKLNYNGKEAYLLDEDIIFNIQYLSKDDDAVYGHVDYNSLSSDGKNYFPDEWITFYSFKVDEWQMYKKYISNEEGEYKFEGTMTMTGKKLGKSSQIIQGNSVDVYEFMAILLGEGTETKNGQVKKEYLIDTNYIGIADGIGIYYYKQNESPTEEEPDNYGWIKKVGKYTVN